MKNSVVATRACLLACSVILSACASYPATKATAIVTAPYPGKGQLDKCKPYADALYKALKAHHIKAWKICYLGGPTASPYLHEMVVYQDAGAFWYADNDFPYPNKSWGKNPVEWVKDRTNAETESNEPVSIFASSAGYSQILKIYSNDKPIEAIAQGPSHPRKKTRRLYAVK